MHFKIVRMHFILISSKHVFCRKGNYDINWDNSRNSIFKGGSHCGVRSRVPNENTFKRSKKARSPHLRY